MMDKDSVMYNLIVMLFDDNINMYNGINDASFVTYICEGVGITREQYKSIMGV